MQSVSEASLAAVHIERDICFGTGAIGYGTASPTSRPLLLDAYLPPDHGAANANARPALVLAHGGAFHRGAKDRDEFDQDGVRNTGVHEYCQRFAARGFVCFSVGYRLTQERMGPPARPIKRNRGELERARIDYVRGLMGLPPAADNELLYGAEAAFEDVAQAFRFVHQHASRWGVDASNIAVGGFSAGGFGAAYAHYALGVPAAAVICLSAGMDAEDADFYVNAAPGQAPVLLFVGESDLPSIPARAQALADRAAASGLGLWHFVVPGKGHFYDRQSAVQCQQATLPSSEACATVEDAIDAFLVATMLAKPKG